MVPPDSWGPLLHSQWPEDIAQRAEAEHPQAWAVMPAAFEALRAALLEAAQPAVHARSQHQALVRAHEAERTRLEANVDLASRCATAELLVKGPGRCRQPAEATLLPNVVTNSQLASCQSADRA